MARDFFPETARVVGPDGRGTRLYRDFWRRNARASDAVLTADETTSEATGSTDAVMVLGDGLRLNNATLLTLIGIVEPADANALAHSIPMWSVGAGVVELVHESLSAEATRRIHTGVGVTIRLAPGRGSAWLERDSVAQRYRVINFEQGAMIAPVFAAGDYLASAGNWTLTAPDVQTLAYYLSGRMLTVVFDFVGTTVSSTPASLTFPIPAGYLSARITRAVVDLSDNGTQRVGLATVSAGGGSLITITRHDGSNFNIATNTTAVRGSMAFEVQAA